MISVARRNAPAALTAILAATSVLFASCKEKHADEAASTSASASSSAPALPASARQESDDADKVRPVYRVDNLPPLPEAERYCGAVRETPTRRREACCPGMGGYAPTGECVRTLSSALRSGAVSIDAAALDACVAAVAKETEGCDWVTSVASPTPAACLGIIKGTIKSRGRCRSNLECEEGLRCLGLGATRPGVCGPPLGARLPCNVATDTLASLTAQDDVEIRHPECAGWCSRKKCSDAVAAGGACSTSLECGSKAVCVSGKCKAGPAPGVGQPCSDECANGARCVKGTCVAPKQAGEACSEDAECRAACVREAGAKGGRCGKQCPSIPHLPPKGSGN